MIHSREKMSWCWSVAVDAVGADVVVRPVRRESETGVGIVADGLLSICAHEEQIVQAKRRWQVWCDRENAKEARARDLAARYA